MKWEHGGMGVPPQTQVLSPIWQTWPKIYSGVEPLQGATAESLWPICGEQQDLVTQNSPEEPGQVPHVAKVAGPVAAIFILHLPGEGQTFLLRPAQG